MHSEKRTVGAGTDYPLKGLLTLPDDPEVNKKNGRQHDKNQCIYKLLLSLMSGFYNVLKEHADSSR